MKKLLLTLGAINLLLQLTSGGSYPSKISPGFYLQELTSPVFYDSFIPIIYEYKYPSWNLLDVTLRDWRTLCKTDDFAPSYTCPVFFYLERFIERLQLEIVNQNTRNFVEQVPASIHNLTDKCNTIQRHFHSLLTSKTSIDDYIHSWTTCPMQGQVVQTSIMDYVYNIKEIYKQMLTRFEQEFSTRAGSGGSSDRQGPAFYVNQITASQSLLIMNYWVEHSRWEDAARSCAVGQIPTTLVKPGNLTAALKLLEEEATKQKYTLSIPANETGSYLISPLTDCTFSDNTSFLVRILVPVKKRTSQIKLVKLQPIPFLLNDDEDTYSICQIFDAEGVFAHDNVSDYLVKSDCLPGELCQVESPAKIPIPNLCASAYFSGSNVDIKKYCNFQCEKVIDGFYPRLPIFRQVSSDTFTVTGNSNLELVIKCEGKRDELVNPDELGSLEIVLPCECSLNFRGQVYLPEQPCGEELRIKLLTPIQFFNAEFLGGEANGSFSGVLERHMMEPAFFSKAEVPGEKGRAERIVEVQTDVESGDVQSIGGAESGRGSSSSTVGIWILLAIQGLAIVGLVGWFVKRGGFTKWGDHWNQPSRMSFSNPLAAVNEEGGRSKRGDEDQFDI